MWLSTRAALGTASRIAASTSSAIAWAASSVSAAGDLEVEAELGALPHPQRGHVVDLAHLGHAERRRRRLLAQRAEEIALRLDVHDDVAAGQLPLDRLLDRARDRVAVRDPGVGGHADHDVGEVVPAGLADAQPVQRRADVERLDRTPGAVLGVARRRVHQHGDVVAHQPPGGHEHERGDEQRGDRVGARVARADEQQADEHRRRADHVQREVHGVGTERGAPVATGAAPRGDGAQRVDGDDGADDGEHVPARVHLALPVDEAHDRLVGDREAREHEHGALGERREVLGLAVAERMAVVRRAPRDADGEERQQRGDDVGARMDRLGDEREAVGEQPDDELRRDERDRRDDRDERGALSGGKPRHRWSERIRRGHSRQAPAAAARTRCS